MNVSTIQNIRFETALASVKIVEGSGVVDLTTDEFEFLQIDKMWIAQERSRVRRCLESMIYGALDMVGMPRFQPPAEFIAAAIAYYVHPVNVMFACSELAGQDFADNIDHNSAPSDASSLFTLVLQLKARGFGVAEDTLSSLRQSIPTNPEA